jgi:hypothetical protein
VLLWQKSIQFNAVLIGKDRLNKIKLVFHRWRFSEVVC